MDGAQFNGVIAAAANMPALVKGYIHICDVPGRFPTV